MLAWGDRTASRRSLYNGTAAARLPCLLTSGDRRACGPRFRRLAPVAALLCAGLAAGCSFQLGSLMPGRDGGDLEPTGALRPPPTAPAQQTADAPPSEFDLAYARKVAADVLARGGKDASAPWENPQTGASGNITPLATSYTAGSFTCRDFLASYVKGESQSWLQGEACRTRQGTWEVKSLTPLKHD